MKVVSCFSGIGLLDQGLIDAGNDVVMQCEKEPVQLKILQATFPNIFKHNDILTLSKEVFDYYEIDIYNCAIVAGAPCQQHSEANPYKSSRTAFILLAQLVRLTYLCRSRFVLVENVKGFLEGDYGANWLSPRMAKIGYFGRILRFEAKALGAPHRRDRIFALYCRDRLILNSYSQRRYVESFTTNNVFQTIIPGIWHNRFVAQPGIGSVAYGFGSVPESVKKCLEVIGNGVVYDVGLFIGRTLKLFNDYFYDSPQGQQLTKISYNPY